MNLKRSKQSDKEILGTMLRSEDAGHDYLQSNDYYSWYQAITTFLSPKKVGEIGVRFGYSSTAMLSGNNSIEKLVGWDNESYHSDCLKYARHGLKNRFPDVTISLNIANSQKMYCLGHDFDLIHVDGDHSTEGAKHDLCLAWNALKVGGWLLCDDLSFGDVKLAYDAFLSDLDIASYYVPTVRGLGVLQKFI
jgi:predicted O-methyltransferase YrrM